MAGDLGSIFANNNKDILYLTIKKYPNMYGLSMFIHFAVASAKAHGVRQKVEVRGPMGLGLDV